MTRRDGVALTSVRLRFEPPDTSSRPVGSWSWREAAGPVRRLAPTGACLRAKASHGPHAMLLADGAFTVEWQETPAPVVLGRGPSPRLLRPGLQSWRRVVDRLWPEETLVLWVGSGWRVR